MRPAFEPEMVQRLFGAVPSARFALMRGLWPEIVGAGIAERTEVVALDGRTLRVRVVDSCWMRVLHRMQREILGRYAHKLGPLAPNRLGFVEEPRMSRVESTRSQTVMEPCAPALPERIMAAAVVIEDPELRRRFTETAARYLGRPQRR